jgi:mannosyltransferase OCH1-like enzyme
MRGLRGDTRFFTLGLANITAFSGDLSGVYRGGVYNSPHSAQLMNERTPVTPDAIESLDKFLLNMLGSMLRCPYLTTRYVGRLLTIICITSYGFSVGQKAFVSTPELEARFLSLSNFSTEYVRALNKSISHHKSIDCSLTSNETTKIPRIIHQTYKSADIPSSWIETSESCKRMNPSYAHYFWTDNTTRDFIQRNYAWFLPTYDSYPYPIQRADAMRYLILQHFGGIYIDMDVGCRRCLDPLLNSSIWFPKTRPFGVSNDVMASIPGHPLMMKLALDLQDRGASFLPPYLAIFWTTGPMYVNNILASWLRRKSISRTADVAEHPVDILSLKQARDAGLAILPPEFYDRTGYSFFRHVPGSSWHGPDAVVLEWTFQHLGKLSILLLSLTGLLIFLRRSLSGLFIFLRQIRR